MSGLHYAVKALPACVQETLSSLGYHRADIRVHARETVSIQDCGSAGRRAFACILNMATGESRTLWGSWNGPNPFETNAVNDYDQEIALLPNMAIIRGSEGSPVFAEITVAPATLAPMLPPVAEVSPEEWTVLNALCRYKSGEYRKNAMAKVPSAVVDAMVSKGWAKRSRTGALTATTEGRNALATSKHTRLKGGL